MIDREMIEKISNVIKDGVVSGDSSWEEIAIEVVKAMRNPTENMILNAELETENYVTFDEAANIYRCFIDKILR